MKLEASLGFDVVFCTQAVTINTHKNISETKAARLDEIYTVNLSRGMPHQEAQLEQKI